MADNAAERFSLFSRPSEGLRDPLSTRLCVAAFLSTVLADAVWVLWHGVSGHPLYVTGLIGVLVVEAVLLASSWSGPVPIAVSYGVNITALAALGLMAVDPTSMIVVVAFGPAWWLGLVHQLRGLYAALVGVLFFALPTLIIHGTHNLHYLLLSMLGIMSVAIPTALTATSFVATGRSILRARRQRDTLVNAVDVGIMVMDARGQITVTNPRMLVFSASTHPGGVPTRAGEDGLIFSDSQGTPFAERDLPTNRALRGEEFEGELIWIGEGSSASTLSVSSRVMRDERGRFEGAVLAYQDVTHLIRAMRVKDDFVASVSHELRTPLTSMLGYVEFILDSEPISADVAEHLGRVSHNGQRLNRLVEDLLHTAADAPPIRPELMNLADLLPSVRDALEVRAQRAGITLEFTAADAWVHADPGRIEQVIENLVSNGIKYHGSNGTVKVDVRPGTRDAVITVSDDGAGMTREDQERIFERFYRSTSIRKDAIAGVGLGLAICRDLVRSHGGSISVTSEPGQGSTFTVRLPLQTPPIERARAELFSPDESQVLVAQAPAIP